MFDVTNFLDWAFRREMQEMVENPPEPGIGGAARAATRSPSVVRRVWNWLRGGSRTATFANNVTREALEAAAADPGPTVMVVTKLTQAPQIGSKLYVWQEGSEALANQAVQQGRIYTARIPKALIETLRTAGLVREQMTSMNGVQHKALYFYPEAAEFIVRFFK